MHEVRFDFDETDTGAGRRGKDERRFAQNVMPLPDVRLNYNGQSIARGTFVPIDDDLFSAWGPIPNFGQLTIRKVLKWLTPRRDIWSIVQFSGLRDPDADWGARLTALQQHFRRWIRRSSTLYSMDCTPGRRRPVPWKR